MYLYIGTNANGKHFMVHTISPYYICAIRCTKALDIEGLEEDETIVAIRWKVINLEKMAGHSCFSLEWIIGSTF